MNCRFLIAALLLFMPRCLSAQRQNDVWMFGDGAGIQFNNTSANVIGSSAMNAPGGSASIADRQTGRLLFYTDGNSVWNGVNQLMPNGAGLAGGRFGMQPALIVPMPGNPLRYFIFTTDGVSNLCANGLQYSIVDMQANGLLGDVIAKNIPLMSHSSEKLCGLLQCQGDGFWVIAHRNDTNAFYAYSITRAGISSPVVSYVGSTYRLLGRSAWYGTVGELKPSFDGSRLAAAVPGVQGQRIELFDFDNYSGVVSHPVALSSPMPGYSPMGLCFSPDGTRLYTVIDAEGLEQSSLFQFDLTGKDSASIFNSRVMLFRETPEDDMSTVQLGADGRIYAASNEGNLQWLGVVAYPDSAGPACSFRRNGIQLVGKSSTGLPNVVYTGFADAIAGPDREMCPGDTIQLHAPAAVGYSWSPAVSLSCTDCASPRAWPATTTTYQVAVTRANGCVVVDSVRITVGTRPFVDAGQSRSICKGASLRLQASPALHYRWEPPIALSCTDCANPVASPDSTITYTLTADSIDGCSASDTVTVFVLDPPAAFAGNDTSICRGQQIQLHASEGIAWKWTPASGLSCDTCRNPVASPETTTFYRMIVTGVGGCTASDNVRVTVNEPPVASAGKDVVICPGDTVSLHASGGESYRWSPDEGLNCADCPDPRVAPERTTVYHLIASNLDGCSDDDSVTVTVIAEGQIEAGPVRTICLGSSIQLRASDGIIWKWSPPDGLSCTGCRDPIASPTTTTHYTVTVYGPEGCLARDTVTINVAPPPKASAGDDATICPGGNTRLHASGARSVQWSPTTGLSCTSCLDPLASPTVTTTYIVTDTSEYGCVGRDSVTVFVSPGQTIRAHIDSTYRMLPGSSMDLPLMLDDKVEQTVDTVTLGIGYNPAILRLHGESLTGTLLDGWRKETIVDSLGGLGVRFIAPGSGPLGGPGTLIKLNVGAYLGDSTGSALPFILSLGYQPCLGITTSGGKVGLDSICGLSYRLITTTASGYALKQNSPNPFNPATRIEFSLGLDGPTRLEVLDAVGRRVALLVEGTMGPGEYEVVWDGSSAPSGLYHYRLISGSWSAMGSMLLVK